MLLTQDVGLSKGGHRRVAIVQIAVLIHMTAYDGLVYIQRVDGPHHVRVGCGGAEADAGIVIHQRQVVLHIIPYGLGSLLHPGIPGRTLHIEASVQQRSVGKHTGAAAEVLLQQDLVA